ncbi:MAG: CSLREA domain-containing protein, partial [Chloroflexi bacterium]|nr:CSLREA domain-containing protein [Chloroflexota bacterium]
MGTNRHMRITQQASLYPALLVLVALLVLSTGPLSSGVRAIAPQIQPSIFTVNSTADAVDANPGDGTCSDLAGRCTLRAAILEANALAGADTINLPAGIYTLSIGGSFEDFGATGDLDITDHLTISGVGAGLTTVDGGGLDRVFHVDPLAPINAPTITVAISGLTIRNGSVGGVRNRGSLTMSAVVVRDNQDGCWGGAIANQGTIWLIDSTVAGNTEASCGAGGFSNNIGTATIANSTISGNVAGGNFGDGAGIHATGGNLTIVNSTISGNSARRHGGGISMDGGATVILDNVTMVSNVADSDSNGDGNGGGVWNLNGVFKSKNTIIAGNVDTGGENPDCYGNTSSQGYNLVQVTSGCVISGDATGNLVGIDPLLGPLANNGGPTFTHALLPGSPAINHVPVAQCKDSLGNALTTDQRGVPRPQGGACDIGAFELLVAVPAAATSLKTARDTDGAAGVALSIPQV